MTGFAGVELKCLFLCSILYDTVRVDNFRCDGKVVVDIDRRAARSNDEAAASRKRRQYWIFFEGGAA